MPSTDNPILGDDVPTTRQRQQNFATGKPSELLIAEVPARLADPVFVSNKVFVVNLDKVGNQVIIQIFWIQITIQFEPVPGDQLFLPKFR